MPPIEADDPGPDREGRARAAGPPLAARVDAAAGDYAALFACVKALVEAELGASRAGIMLGLQSLGFGPRGYVGGYFVTGTNAIVLNRDLLNYVRIEAPDLHGAVAFHLLLHEYLHTLGHLDEGRVRRLVHRLCRAGLGEDHPATRIAAAFLPGVDPAAVPEVLRDVVHPGFGWTPPGGPDFEIVRGFDPDASPYIQ